MPVTDNPPNNFRPSLFKLIPSILVLLLVCIIIPIMLSLVSPMLLIDFLIIFLNLIDCSKELFSFIKFILPIIIIIEEMFILVSYIRYIPNILEKIPLDIRKTIRDYLTHKDWKISFYRKILFFKTETKSLFSVSYYFESKILDKIFNYGFQIFILILGLFSFFLLVFTYNSYAGRDFLQFNILESTASLDFLNTYLDSIEYVTAFIWVSAVSLAFVIGLFTIYSFALEMIPVTFIFYFFSSKKGFVDTSEIPISFLNLAIQELETVNFSESFDQIQHKKIQISNFINYSLKCVKVNKESVDINYMNFCYQKCRGLYNIDAIDDIIFRANGLFERMNKTLIKINHMNCFADKEEIKKDLEYYLKVIENKDLSEIDPKELISEGLTIDKALLFLLKNVLLPVILVILTQRLI